MDKQQATGRLHPGYRADQLAEGATVRDLRGIVEQPDSSRFIRLIGAIVAVAVFGVLAFFVYQEGLLYGPPKQVVTDQELPSPSPPVIPQRI